MSCHEGAGNITMHAVGLNIDKDKIRVLEEGGTSINVTSIEYDEKRQFLIIHLNEHLKAGKNYILNIYYTGEINSDMKGLFWSSYKNLDTNQTEYLVATQFEATHARRAFPCFDEPEMKARFKVDSMTV